MQKQGVKFKNGMSDCVDVDYGVPQGTALGLALFIFYINDIKNSSEHCDVMPFVYGNMLHFVGTNPEEMVII